MAKRNEVTEVHLAVYEKEARKWIKYLSLDQWEVHFRLAPMDKRAQIWVNYEGRVVTFELSDTWHPEGPLTHADIKASAKHESIELALCPLSYLGANRWQTEEEYNAAREEVVRKFEKIL